MRVLQMCLMALIDRAIGRRSKFVRMLRVGISCISHFMLLCDTPWTPHLMFLQTEDPYLPFLQTEDPSGI